MKKIREVCEIVGVSRRTLQEYDKVGLLKPTEKSSAGYWLYDDEAIGMLMLIQVFIQSGYKRSEVKKIIDSPEIDFVKEYDKAIDVLEKKKKRINGNINLLNQLKSVSMDVTDVKTYDEKSLNESFAGSSFLNQWNELLRKMSV
ncbi:MerR family transcriptional regulator [Eubacterium xylanophilum]|uniref:MerR family transcriptional regulator n=1 Tax=Eubacterium xylanophilum TaxID=39497 RepID=UPI0004B38839|nr:MerR family transcriptional regulator [Eubacterium xylanophilum]